MVYMVELMLNFMLHGAKNLPRAGTFTCSCYSFDNMIRNLLLSYSVLFCSCQIEQAMIDARTELRLNLVFRF